MNRKYLKIIIVDDYDTIAFLDMTDMSAIEISDICNITKYGSEEDQSLFLHDIGYYKKFTSKPLYSHLMTGINSTDATPANREAEQEKAKELDKTLIDNYPSITIQAI